ncbi:MAG: metallophosphoesterase, partial [Ginsengibacter sp.]
DSLVDANIVNRAMIGEMNLLPQIKFPTDSGVNSGKLVGPVDFVIEGGDIANRMEIPIQSAAASWAQFEADYGKEISLKNRFGKRTQLLMIPGNHDITDAIGFYRLMNPKTDATAMTKIYNLMMSPVKPLDKTQYNYSKDKINYSKNINGIHLMFITLWPDSSERIWMKKDLHNISPGLPVILFTHDQPEAEAKHFTNPNENGGINAHDRFENLLAEHYKDSTAAVPDNGNTTMEQVGWVNFLLAHRNIVAYFHGNDNFNQYYVYKGPDSTVALNTFRVDSPIKGDESSKYESKLSFQVITINTKSLTMTVRECLWNDDLPDQANSVKWGQSKTVSLRVPQPQ